jgi:hypothetical protein
MRLSLPHWGKEIAYTYDLPPTLAGDVGVISNKLTMPQAVQRVIAAVDEVATETSARTLACRHAPRLYPRRAAGVDVLGERL